MTPSAIRVLPEHSMSEHTSVPTTKIVQAAGSLIWRIRDGRLEVLIIHRPHRKDWSWPKGQLDKGELQPVAAVRETSEETGLSVALGTPLPGLQYLLNDSRVKRSHYWAAQVVPPKSRILNARFPVPEVNPGEVDEQRWVDTSTARGMLTRRADQIPLDALENAYESERLDTWPLIIVRHGKAMDRARWAGGEKSRPLTPFGAGQAAALSPLLAAFDVRRLISSTWQRCVATLDPFAQSAGLKMELNKGLTEKSHRKDPGVALNVFREVLDAGVGTVICTHRPVLPAIITQLRAHSRSKAARALPRSAPFLQPGSILVAQVSRNERTQRIVSIERFQPTVW